MVKRVRKKGENGEGIIGVTPKRKCNAFNVYYPFMAVYTLQNILNNKIKETLHFYLPSYLIK